MKEYKNAIIGLISACMLGWAGWLSTTLLQVKDSVTEIRATYIKDADIDFKIKENNIPFTASALTINVRISQVEKDVSIIKLDQAILNDRLRIIKNKNQ